MVKERVKRAQVQLSFGMIFSIIIIIATLAVAGYVLVKFAKLGTNVSCKLFYSDLQERIDRAWSEDGATRDIFSGKVPNGIEKVCIGNFSLSPNLEDREIYEKLKFSSRKKTNLFFYSSKEKVCGDGGFSYILEHAKMTKFFCVNVDNGKIKVNIEKDISDVLVTLKP